MIDLIIQPQEGKKGRSFSATCLAAVVARGLFEDARQADNIRPVWAMFAAPEAQLKPFMTNLKLGRKAEPTNSYRSRSEERFEFLRSSGFHITWQKESEGAIATIFQPDWFRLDPGMVDPEGVSFIMLTPGYWIQEQTIKADGPLEYVRSLGYPYEIDPDFVTTAYLFAAYVDRRTRCPLIADGRFYTQLLCASLQAGFASFPEDGLKHYYSYSDKWGTNRNHGFRAHGLADVGIRYALSFHAKHHDWEPFLAEQVGVFSSYVDQTSKFVPASNLVDLSAFNEAHG